MPDLKLEEINDQATWDAFVAAQPYAQFTQSWAWGEFQRSRGLSIRRLALFDQSLQTPDSRLQTVCQFIRQRGRLGLGYWLAPRGPVFASGDKEEQLRALGNFRLNVPTSVFCVFSRFEPLIRERKDLSPLGLVRVHAMNPATTLLIDLTKSEDELLAAMHPKTRYNIKVAEKHRVNVRELKGKQDVLAFISLTEETAKRDGFKSHEGEYLLATLEKSGLARLRIAELDGEALAANLEMTYGDTVTYLHGASSSTNRQAMAPYLLQWDAIRQAKAQGKRYYDFWGCNPEREDDPYFKPSWSGITRFKRGWGGELMNLAGTWDLPKLKWVYRMLMGRG